MRPLLLLLTLPTAGCSLLTDFDRDWPDDLLWEQCAEACRQAADCVAGAPNCPGLRDSQASRGMIEGRCLSDCVLGEGEVAPGTALSPEECEALAALPELDTACRSRGLCLPSVCEVGDARASPWVQCLAAAGEASIRRALCAPACEGQSREYWVCTAESVRTMESLGQLTDLERCEAYTDPSCTALLTLSGRWE